ncbi:PAS domain-containing protein [Nocardioides guangzhouensis]|uniref:PAS domain-containing protein n=1 Tax=Nocardioides guangzhouensis TaxID=2497878 RepID=A0A4Q4ZHJ5_9ACTN|nr:SpoIIE family protein phosphatase [Nocardioides guangzhouensis]RYP87717.1 PAS domain-containing protein [Nocardioides guangzhouensis]
MPVTPRESLYSLRPDENSVGRARWLVQSELEAWGAPDLVESAVLATSELVTNAVVHAGTTVQVRLTLDEDRLRLEVQDQHPGRMLPLGTAAPPDDAEHGRGLLITASLASSWGVDYTDTAKRVWVEIDRGRPGPLPAAPVATEVAGVLVGVVELSEHGVVRGWNDDARRLLGWAPEEVLDETWEGLVSGPEQRLGEVAVRARDGSLVRVFVTRHAVRGGVGSALLLVPTIQRSLLERAPATPVETAPPGDRDPSGLGDDALARLGLDDYLSLVVERCRARVGADATYLLLARYFDSDLEVVAVSGLDARLHGRRLDRDAPGTLNRSNPRLPVVEDDLADGAVPLLTGTGLRSLVVVPVVVEGQAVGALGAATEAAGGLDQTQAALLHRFAGSLALATDRARLRAAEQERRHWLGLVDEAGVLLADSLDEKMTMALTAQVVVPQLASWCAIHLRDARGHLVLRHVWHEDEGTLDALRATLETAGADSLPGPVHTLPLTARGRDIGTLTLGRPGAPPLRGEVYRIADSLARRAAMAIDNARAHGELKAAGEALQRSLLPPSIPAPPGLDVGVVYEPADESTTAGGDFYDLFALGDGRWCWVVGDVCGTGAEAAAVTGLARHTIRALAMTGIPIAVTLERLNSAILDEGARARFLTLACGVIGPVRGRRARLGLVVAGHPPPFLVRHGEVRQVGRPQMLLGVEERVTYTEEYLELEQGDLLVAVTDGVLERRDGARMLGEQGFESELAKAADLPAQMVAEHVRELVLDFVTGPNRDDMAVLALKLPPPGSGSA